MEKAAWPLGFMSEVGVQGGVSIDHVIARANLPTPDCHPSTCCLLNACGKKCSVKVEHQNKSLFSYNVRGQ